MKTALEFIGIITLTIIILFLLFVTILILILPKKEQPMEQLDYKDLPIEIQQYIDSDTNHKFYYAWAHEDGERITYSLYDENDLCYATKTI